MDKNGKANLLEAVETRNPAKLAELVVEVMLDNEEDVQDIAVDFIENEVGRLDWQTNWNVVKRREDPVAMVQRYMDRLGLVADASAVVTAIDHMSQSNPGRWK